MSAEEERRRLIAEIHERVDRLGAVSAPTWQSSYDSHPGSRLRHFLATTAILELVAGSLLGIGMVLGIFVISSW